MEENDDGFSAFLTDLDSSLRAKVKNPKLDNARKDHAKLMEIVAAFGNKVGVLADKHRSEYMVAYEHHMQDVQKELHVLREKVRCITSNKVRDDKIESLKTEEEFLKNEALHYDDETNELRIRARKITDAMHAEERERDWLLKKLRKAKNRYNKLKTHWESVRSDGEIVSFFDSTSHDSSVSIELNKQTGKKYVNPLHNGIKTERYSGHKLTQNYDMNNWNISEINTKALSKKEINRHSVVTVAKQEEMRNFVDNCIKSCHKGIWSKVKKRPLPELLNECVRLIENPEYDLMGESRMHLAQELAATPEVYWGIADLLTTGKSDLKQSNDVELLEYEMVWNDLEPIEQSHLNDPIKFVQGDDFEGSDLPEMLNWESNNFEGEGEYNDQNSQNVFRQHDNNNLHDNDIDTKHIVLADDLINYLRNGRRL